MIGQFHETIQKDKFCYFFVKPMPSKDIIHDSVKNALIKDDWILTADPYIIKYEEVKLFADLAAERPLLAERSGEKIVVEIKSFTGVSFFRNFEEALGQYIIYRNLLTETVPEYELYLAISERTYINFFQKKSDSIHCSRK